MFGAHLSSGQEGQALLVGDGRQIAVRIDVVVIGHHDRKTFAAADQEVDDVIAKRIVIGMAVQVDAAAVLWQRIFHDLRQHRAETVGHQEDFVGEIDRLVDA